MRVRANAIVMILVCVSLVFASIAWAEDVSPESAEEELKPLAVGDVAVDLKAKDAAGNSVDLVKFGSADRKAMVFLNTACGACRTELGLVQKLVKGRDVDLIVVATDMGDYAKISAYKEGGNYKGEWFQDEDFSVPTRFGFFFTPACVVLDKSGKVLFSKGGFNKRKVKEFEKEFKAAL